MHHIGGLGTRTRTFTYSGINFVTVLDTEQANQEKGNDIKQRKMGIL